MKAVVYISVAITIGALAWMIILFQDIKSSERKTEANLLMIQNTENSCQNNIPVGAYLCPANYNGKG